MQLLSLGHVTLRSADFDATERFYPGVLGLRVGPRPALSVPGIWFYLGDEAVLHVLPPAVNQRADAAGLIDHFALNARGLSAFQQRLQAAGQAFECRRHADTGTWQLFLADPDGVRVELCFAADEAS